MQTFAIALLLIDTGALVLAFVLIRRLFRSTVPRAEGDTPERAKDWEFMNKGKQP